jgi:hypothetical protein
MHTAINRLISFTASIHTAMNRLPPFTASIHTVINSVIPIIDVVLLYLMNINKEILTFYWLRFDMWFYFIFHGMTTKSSKEVIMYHVVLHWPVDIDRLKKLKWRPINPASIEIWKSIQLLHFIEYIQQYFNYVVAVSYIGGSCRTIALDQFSDLCGP